MLNSIKRFDNDVSENYSIIELIANLRNIHTKKPYWNIKFRVKKIKSNLKPMSLFKQPFALNNLIKYKDHKFNI